MTEDFVVSSYYQHVKIYKNSFIQLFTLNLGNVVTDDEIYAHYSFACKVALMFLPIKVKKKVTEMTNSICLQPTMKRLGFPKNHFRKQLEFQ